MVKTDKRLQKEKTDIQPLFISDFRFLGIHMEDNLTWSVNTTIIIKKAQQRLHFLRILRNYQLTQNLLMSFTVALLRAFWHTACVCGFLALQRIITTAQKIIGCPLPSMEELHTSPASWKLKFSRILLTVQGSKPEQTDWGVVFMTKLFLFWIL